MKVWLTTEYAVGCYYLTGIWTSLADATIQNESAKEQERKRLEDLRMKFPDNNFRSHLHCRIEETTIDRRIQVDFSC